MQPRWEVLIVICIGQYLEACGKMNNTTQEERNLMTQEEMNHLKKKLDLLASMERMGSGEAGKPVNKFKIFLQKLVELHGLEFLGAMVEWSPHYLQSMIDHDELKLDWRAAQLFESCLGIPAHFLLNMDTEYRIKMGEYKQRNNL